MLEWLRGKSKNSGDKPAPLDINPEELNALSANQYYLLDLRDLKAFREGHIKGAHQVPFSELNRRMFELPTDRLIITVDVSERRSRQAAKQLRQAALEARSLKGGLNAWTGKLVK
ncbi:rhodanese-like domain-containing protein [Sulfobacillus harzensis]|uniref:Rhodanese-like domain-containing protein n=1 Tax=Sulfobacillus harzensis TaxID=2729629 RepID=A0A7Y0L3B4_9FIRM|nr:rhodanese-like domain-containing protein [Sulfobacillus harzensis]NMP22303.1 rhodanese-like domain-containing protein [Sulfobacillus harzensis]